MLSNWKEFMLRNKVFLQIIIIPLVISIIPIVIRSDEANCAFIIILLSVYWILEPIPVSITSVLPVFMFPLFGIIKSSEISPFYFQDSVMFIFASVIIGLGIESSGLHKKIALKACMLVGSKPKWLLLGIMSVTAFLSIWISNTATTSMLLPITITIVKQLVKIDPKLNNNNKSALKMNELSNNEISEINKIDQSDENELTDEMLFQNKEAKNIMKGFCLSICFAATIGGSASLIGTASNIVFKNHFDKYHPKDSLNFLTFMLFALPFAVLHLISAWIVICLMWLPKGSFMNMKSLFFRKKNHFVVKPKSLVDQELKLETIEDLIKKQYEKLGPLTWEQLSIGFYFIFVVILWMTRDLFFVPGWSILFKEGYVTDSSSAIFVVFLITSWPKLNIFKGEKYIPLLEWKFIQKNFPWSIILLVGGSLAMADGCEKSGLSTWFGNFLEDVIPKDGFAALVVISLFSVIGTEFISNLSMASILLPILERLAKINKIDYHYLLVPQALTVNFSFMFPAAAPTNALVFACGYLSLKDMIISGIIIKLIGLGLLFIASNTWLVWIFVENISTNSGTNTTSILNTTTMAI